jgi:glycine cleavage system aminomethyltransferase T
MTSPGSPAHRHPLHPNVRRSPYFEQAERAGAVEYMVYNHMYMPIGYGRPPEEDYAALIERVTLWDVGAQRQTQLRGVDALRLGDFLCARDLHDLEVDACRYTMVCDLAGKIMAECIVLRPADDTVWISHGDVDLTLWAQAIASWGGFDVEVSEPDVAPLQVQGPRSLDVLRALVGEGVDTLRSYRSMRAEVAGVPLVISRTGWSGDLGFEVYPRTAERAAELWNAVLRAGELHGILVSGPNLIRACEHGITDTHYFVNSGMTPFEAGAGWSVDLDSGSFVGREALLEAAASPPARRTVGIVADEGVTLPRLESFWPVRRGNPQVGEVRWAVGSIALDRNVAIALVDASVELGDDVVIAHPEGEGPGRVVDLPFVKDRATG